MYYLAVAVFLPTSETAIFSRAFERVRNDPQVFSHTRNFVLLMLDETSYWGEYASIWRKFALSVGTKSTNCVFKIDAPYLHDRSLHRLDPQNVDHLFMRFYVEGDQGKATVRLEMTKVRPLKEFL